MPLGEPSNSAASGLRFSAHAKLVAFRIRHDDIVIVGVHSESYDPSAERNEPFHLSGLVITVEVEMHLVSCGDRRVCHLKGYVDLVPAQDAELVTLKRPGNHGVFLLAASPDGEPVVEA